MDSTPQIVLLAACLAVTILGSASMLVRGLRRRAPSDAPPGPDA